MFLKYFSTLKLSLRSFTLLFRVEELNEVSALSTGFTKIKKI